MMKRSHLASVAIEVVGAVDLPNYLQALSMLTTSEPTSFSLLGLDDFTLLKWQRRA